MRPMTRHWTPERLAITSLHRQFPRIRPRGPAAVVEAYRRLGPVQTQSPRAAHLALAARLPGVTHEAITAAFEAYSVVKATNLRGTVHTSTAEQHPWLAAVSAAPRDRMIARSLGLDGLTPAQVTDEVERYASGQWRERKDLVAHMWEWLDSLGSGRSNGAEPSTAADSLFWGHARLVRRPRDTAWERRTDVYHQTAETVFDVEPAGVGAAFEYLVRLHLSAYGPATRRDIAWWMGSALTPVDHAITRLGDELVRYEADGRDRLLDLAEPPRGGADPGVRLLPEFDGLLLGYAPANRGRFAHPDHLARLFEHANGLMSPSVLRDGQLVATWQLRPNGKRTHVEVETLPEFAPVREDEIAGPIASVEAALAIDVNDVHLSRSR